MLDRFNRKERYFLLCHALGMKRFSLSKDLRDGLQAELYPTIPADDEVGVWMDYHFDWLTAALAKWCEQSKDVFSNGNGLVHGNQEDLDLLIAFADGKDYHLVFIEAKAYSGWDNRQANSKAERLRKMFGECGDTYERLKPHYFLLSPREPGKLDCSEWPDWMKRNGKPVWLELPVCDSRLEVNRWDKGRCKKSANGGHFRVT